MIRSYRIRMRPTPAQRVELRRWFECGRWAYNAVVRAVDAGEVSPATRRFAVQKVYQRHRSELQQRFPGVHSTIIRESMYQERVRTTTTRGWTPGIAVNAYRTNLAKADAMRRRGQPPRPFCVHERSAHDNRTEVLPLEASQAASATKRSADAKVIRRTRGENS